MQGRHLFILLAFALFASPLAAQETTGKIQGRVVDAQSLAVPGATVTATGVQGSKNTVTDTDGRYTIPFLTPGVYSVRAELQGFKAIEQKDVVGSRRPDGRRAPQARGRRRGGSGAGDRRGARRRHLVHDDRRRHQHGRPEVDSGRPHVQRRRCICRPASAAPARSAPRTRRCPAAPASRTSTSWTARTSPTPATAALAPTRLRSARSATRRRTTSSRKSRSRPAATRPSSARRPAAS